MFLHLIHSPLPFHFVYLSVNVVFVPQAAGLLFFLLLLSALWWMRLSKRRDWWWVELGVDLMGRAQ